MTTTNRLSSIAKNKEKVLSLIIFVILGIIALQIPVNNLAGSGAKFTLFDLVAPTAGAFLGSWVGIVAVFLMGVFDVFIDGVVDKGAVIRLFPVLFGVLFFALHTRSGQALHTRSGHSRSGQALQSRSGQARLSKIMLLIPLLAVASFNLNEVGRSVWYYSLFWTIPLLVYPVVKKSLVARSLASVFVAHSVGGAIWIWAFNLPAAVWQGLIPTVAMERLIMALGVAASYILMNNLVVVLSKKVKLLRSLKVDSAYIRVKI